MTLVMQLHRTCKKILKKKTVGRGIAVPQVTVHVQGQIFQIASVCTPRA